MELYTAERRSLTAFKARTVIFGYLSSGGGETSMIEIKAALDAAFAAYFDALANDGEPSIYRSARACGCSGLGRETCRSVAARFGVAVSSVVKWSQRHRA